MTNEEQRACIEVLKQALEVKMNETGILQLIRSLSQSSHSNEIDLFIELNNIKSWIDHHQKDKKQGEEKTKNMRQYTVYDELSNHMIN